MIITQRQSRNQRVKPRKGQCRRDGELSVGRKAQAAVLIPHPAAALGVGGAISSSVRHSRKGLPNTEGGIFMYMHDRTLYRTPFSAAYWRSALNDFKQVRTLTFAALMVAVCSALSHIPSIPISAAAYSARVTWGWLGRSICGMVGGPITALVFGFAEDTISFIIKPSGVYFPGYALTTMLGTMIYALFLYRTKPTVIRIFLAKLLTNVLNVTLGALWSTILSGTDKGYIYYATISFWKNLISLPLQTVMLCVLVAVLAPIMSRMGLIAPRGRDAMLGFWWRRDSKAEGAPQGNDPWGTEQK